MKQCYIPGNSNVLAVTNCFQFGNIFLNIKLSNYYLYLFLRHRTLLREIVGNFEIHVLGLNKTRILRRTPLIKPTKLLIADLTSGTYWLTTLPVQVYKTSWIFSVNLLKVLRSSITIVGPRSILGTKITKNISYSTRAIITWVKKG